MTTAPCPFCGSTLEELHAYTSSDYHDTWVHVLCRSCCARGPRSLTEEHAWDEWNRRASAERERPALQLAGATIKEARAQSHIYRLKYKLETECGQFTSEQIEDGGADALILISCLYPAGGSYSQAVVSMDGRTGNPVTSKDLFKAWLMLGAALGDKEDLDYYRRELAKAPLDAMAEMTGTRTKKETP